MIEALLWGFCGVCALALLITYWEQINPWASPEERALARWERDCKRRGLTPAEKREEFEFRMRLAPIRRIASDETLKRPSAAEEIIAKAISDEMRVSYLIDFDQAKQIEAAIRALPMGEILYPDAYAAYLGWLTAAAKSPKRTAQDREDFVSALSTLRR